MLVQFVLVAVTASTRMMDALVVSQSAERAVQSLPIWAQFLLAVLAHAKKTWPEE